jgi:hypothetical protein
MQGCEVRAAVAKRGQSEHSSRDQPRGSSATNMYISAPLVGAVVYSLLHVLQYIHAISYCSVLPETYIN